MKTLILVLFASAMFVSCGNIRQESTDGSADISTTSLSESEMAFMENLSKFCGKSFAGKETYSKEGRDSWADKSMVISFTLCEPGQINIPFQMDNDRSRTWMFINEDGKLRFRHDHRHEDGSPEDLTLYGGYADGSGTALKQSFPADDYTNELLNDQLDRVWHVSLSEDLSLLTYELGYLGEIVFRAQFDLTQPI